MEHILSSSAILAIAAYAGYVFGVIKRFGEEKQKVYQEILPIMQKAVYDKERPDKAELNKALGKAWLYASKEAAKKIDWVFSITVKPERGNITDAMQEAIVEMRKDVQIWPWERLNPKDVKHLYLFP
jgi:hypothetical protein